jgi:hypothetical protein
LKAKEKRRYLCKLEEKEAEREDMKYFFEVLRRDLLVENK